MPMSTHQQPSQTAASYIVRDADGQALGKFTTSDPLEGVPDAFAYTYTAEQAASVAGTFPGATVEAAAQKSA